MLSMAFRDFSFYRLASLERLRVCLAAPTARFTGLFMDPNIIAKGNINLGLKTRRIPETTVCSILVLLFGFWGGVQDSI